jgi:hypothetical protein
MNFAIGNKSDSINHHFLGEKSNYHTGVGVKTYLNKGSKNSIQAFKNNIDNTFNNIEEQQPKTYHYEYKTHQNEHNPLHKNNIEKYKKHVKQNEKLKFT